MPRAHPILAELREVGEVVMAETLAGIGFSDQAVLHDLLSKLRGNLQGRSDDAAPVARVAGGR